ncbi:MAG TPA: DUF5050 domain-containing protein [Saprospiraceae bacterium]|nr:DUF5050 domain-containing protein [Saprospiraceae bacterium]
MKSLKNLLPLFLLAVLAVTGCKKDDPVKPKPVASFTASQTTVFVGDEVVFTNTSENATSYTWSFGDGTTSTDKSPKKAYTAVGEYTVNLTATGEGGTATASAKITVTKPVSKKTLYYIELGDKNKISKVSLTEGSQAELFLDIVGKGGVGLAYDATNDKIYYSDFENADEGIIWRMNGDGTGLEKIASGITDPYSIAIDLKGGKIFWADDNGNISRANLDGSNVEKSFINVADGQMRGIAFNSKTNKLYFYEVNNEDLYIANADGTGVAVLIPGVYGYGIFVDEVNEKLYYDERNAQALMQASLDGTGAKTISSTGKTRIHGIAIDYDANKLYWADRDKGEIKRANLDGSGEESFLSGPDSPRGIFIK